MSRRLLIQAVKRSPLDLRQALAIRPEPDAASLAHVLSAHSRLPPALRARAERGMDPILQQLLDLRSTAYSEPCWGYHFDVETRFFRYDRETPNTIATAFAGHALIDAHVASGRADLLDLAAGAGEFFVDRMGVTDGSGGGYFGYFPGDRTPIHNASALASALLARLAGLTGRSDFAAAARAGIGFLLHHQRDDGSWPYAEGKQGGWVDNLHTGYVLDSLRLHDQAVPDAPAEAAYWRGLELYAKKLFLEDGTPKARIDAVHPIDAQSAAQGIRTFSLAASARPSWIGRAWRVHGFASEKLQRSDGAFAFQRNRLWTDRIPHVRWVEAPMLDALSRLQATSERQGLQR